jgi:hypothetical protein
MNENQILNLDKEIEVTDDGQRKNDESKDCVCVFAVITIE